jgi:TolB-like protein
VAVAPFEIWGGFSQSEAETLYELFVSELVTGGTVKVVDRNSYDARIFEMKFQISDWSDSNKVAQLGKTLNADSIIRCILSKLGNQLILTARIMDINTGQIFSSAILQLNNINEIFSKLKGFVGATVSNLPRPLTLSSFTGTWRSVVNGENGIVLTCILEFRTDGIIQVTRYDTDTISETWTRRRHEIKRDGLGEGRYSVRDENEEIIIIDITLTLNSSVPELFRSIHSEAYFYKNNPNKIELGSMNCVFNSYSNRFEDKYYYFNKL